MKEDNNNENNCTRYPTYGYTGGNFNNKRFIYSYCPTDFQNQLYNKTEEIKQLLLPFNVDDKMIHQAMDISLTEETNRHGDIFSVYDLDTIDDMTTDKLVNRTIRILKDEIGEQNRIEFFVQNNSRYNWLLTENSFKENTAKDNTIYRKYRQGMTFNMVG